MKKKLLVGLAVGVMLGMAGGASASLIVDGTVNYMGADRQLIYDTDRNITWLDYSNAPALWSSQVAWADTLSLVVNGVTYDDWRLPSVGSNPQQDYNQTDSEMGHLWYTELGLTGGPDHSSEDLNSQQFDGLVSFQYWSGAVYAVNPYFAWLFSSSNGAQTLSNKDYTTFALGLAVRSGQVTFKDATPTPEPATMLLMGTGLAGLIGARKKKKK